MKNLKCKRIMIASTLALVLSCLPALAQGPVIASFGRNGELVCTNLLAGTTASVEWASSVLGPWTNSWEALSAVIADTNGVIRVSVPMFYRVRGFSAPSNMVHIPASTFTMGDDGPPTVVTIGRAFWMGKYEVTQGDYLAVTGSNPSGFTGDLSRPVECVSWDDATNYCAQLTALEWAAGRLPAGWAYRLPTEPQWEYACRAGTTTPFYYGEDLRSGMANFDGNYEWIAGDFHYNPDGIYLGRTTAVGSYAPNAWGLYDMHGNVWEWCQDWASPPASERVFRGGDWSNNAYYSRSASRDGYPAESWNNNLGFRVVLAPDQP